MIPYPLPSEPSSSAITTWDPAPSAGEGVTASGSTTNTKRRGSGHDKFPLDVALTPFHLAMVFYDRLRILCTVSQQLVFEDSYDQVCLLFIFLMSSPAFFF